MGIGGRRCEEGGRQSLVGGRDGRDAGVHNPQFSFVRFGSSLAFPFPPPSPSPVSSASPHTRVPRVFSLVGLLVWSWVGVVFVWLTKGALFMVLSLLCLGLGCALWGSPLWVMWLVMTGWASLWPILAGCGHDW